MTMQFIIIQMYPKDIDLQKKVINTIILIYQFFINNLLMLKHINFTNECLRIELKMYDSLRKKQKYKIKYINSIQSMI